MPSLKPYPAYADTDLPWLAKIPKHWEVQRAKFIFKKMSRPVREEDDVVTAFRDGTVTLRTNRRTEGFTFSIKEIGYQGIRKGDLVIHQMDGFAGAIGVSDSDGKSTPIYSVCVPLIPASTYFYAYLLRQMAKSDFILSLAKGIRERSSDFRFDVFKELELPIPPLEEQQAIAAYLDRQTAKIDALIAKKQRLLDLLAEQRAALISQAVTKGLNPNVKMKDSSVAWLGQVPSHWEVKRLKYVCDINPSKTEIANINRNIEVSFLPMELIEPGYLRLESSKTLNDVWQGFTYFRENDVVVAKITPCFENGKGAVAEGLVNGIGFGTTELHVLRSNASTLPKFIYYLTSSNVFHNLGEALMTGTAGQKRVPDSFISNFYAPIPPVEEQAEIVNYIEGETKKLDSLSSRAEKVIERLQEYRATLISSVVTGKVDVRSYK